MNDETTPRAPGDDKPQDRHGTARSRAHPFASIWRRLRTYLLTGLVVLGPLVLTIYLTIWVVTAIDSWVKPLVPKVYDPATYLPFDIPGFGLLFALIVLTLVGAIAANLLGRKLLALGDALLGRMPVVRNLHGGLKQIFESVLTVADTAAAAAEAGEVRKVGLIEFPSKGLWSIVFVTGEATGAIQNAEPGGTRDLVAVFMPTGMVPPTGFVCFVPRKDVLILPITMEDAAKTIISAGMFMPDAQQTLKNLADRGRPLD